MTPFNDLRKLLPGRIVTVAGVGYEEGIPARDADAGWPMGVVRRGDGELIVVDYLAHRLWRIDRQGMLHRFAGDGVAGNRGDGGPALEARMRHPHDLCLDREGNLYFTDLGNVTVRRIDAGTGIINRVAGSGRRGRGGDGGPALEAEFDCPCGLAVDEQGRVYISDEWSCTDPSRRSSKRHHPGLGGSSARATIPPSGAAAGPFSVRGSA